MGLITLTARSTKHLINALEEFRHLGIDLSAIEKTIDTASPLGRRVFVIVAAVAELERSITSERIKSGLQRVQRRGASTLVDQAFVGVPNKLMQSDG